MNEKEFEKFKNAMGGDYQERRRQEEERKRQEEERKRQEKLNEKTQFEGLEVYIYENKDSQIILYENEEKYFIGSRYREKICGWNGPNSPRVDYIWSPLKGVKEINEEEINTLFGFDTDELKRRVESAKERRLEEQKRLEEQAEQRKQEETNVLDQEKLQIEKDKTGLSFEKIKNAIRKVFGKGDR